jgi:ferritin-like metal-binding protein YciE
MEIQSLETLLHEELKDILGAEKQVLEALPKMIEAASAKELKKALKNHLEQTREHVDRLGKAFEALGHKAESKTCKGMAGLLQEGAEVLKTKMPDAVKDAAIIGAAQRVEHYEMAAYGAARSFAKQLDRLDVAHILQNTLNEEGEADRVLTEIAEFAVNIEAAQLPVAAV